MTWENVEAVRSLALIFQMMRPLFKGQNKIMRIGGACAAINSGHILKKCQCSITHVDQIKENI